MNAYIKFGEILPIGSQDKRAETKIWRSKGHNSLTGTIFRKMMGNNPTLDLINMNAYIKYGENMSVILKILILSKTEILAYIKAHFSGA